MNAGHLPRTAALLGGGAVGGVLLPALRTAGVRIVAAWNRTQRTPQWRTGALPRALREAEVVLLSVSDPAVGALCAQLVAERLVGKGQLVAHLAGALDLSPLEPALQAGARVGSLHPLRSIPPGSRADQLAGAACGIDGSDDEARDSLHQLALGLGMKPMAVRGDRALYHAAAVLAGGSLVALVAEAVRAFQAATGATEDEARAALQPLARGALEATATKLPSAVLTGPVPRGDAQTLARHLAALERFDPAVGALYRELSHASLRLSREGHRLEAAEVQVLEQALALARPVEAVAAAGSARPARAPKAKAPPKAGKAAAQRPKSKGR